ncbi:MAG: regulator of RNase E activity RraB, partial [Flavobacteriales bacterium]
MNSENTSELAEWHEFNQETIEALILDGSDASQAHTIEYHFASADFDV